MRGAFFLHLNSPLVGGVLRTIGSLPRRTLLHQLRSWVGADRIHCGIQPVTFETRNESPQACRPALCAPSPSVTEEFELDDLPGSASGRRLEQSPRYWLIHSYLWAKHGGTPSGGGKPKAGCGLLPHDPRGIPQTRPPKQTQTFTLNCGYLGGKNVVVLRRDLPCPSHESCG